MDISFHSQVVPEPVTILGRKLKPFSLGHQLLLERIGSPFVDGSSASFADLILAVSICSRDFDAAVAWLDSGSKAGVRWWGFKVWLGVKLGTANLARALVMFRAYIANGSHCPTLLMEEGARAKRLEVPLVALIHGFMVKHGAGFNRALATPYGASLWLYCIHCATEGRAEIVGEEWRKEVAEMQLTPQAEIDRWIEIHNKATRRN